MRAFVLTLRVLAVVFIAVGASHLLLGLLSDMSLGARVPPDVVADPVLDSQNRFYGVVFAGNGALLWLVARDPARWALVLRIVSWFVFLGGLARVLAMILHGVPTAPVLLLIAIEVVGFPLLLWWHQRVIGTDRPVSRGAEL